MTESFYTVFKTKLGWIGAVASDFGFSQTTLPMLSSTECIDSVVLNHNQLTYSPDYFVKFSKKVVKYFEGEKVSFDEKLDYSTSSEFSQNVWNICRLIPFAQTRTYKWVASKICSPWAYRAVGQALAKNRFPLIVPCHRVISYNGEVNGFVGNNRLDSYVPDLKALLINLESNRF